MVEQRDGLWVMVHGWSVEILGVTFPEAIRKLRDIAPSGIPGRVKGGVQ